MIISDDEEISKHKESQKISTDSTASEAAPSTTRTSMRSPLVSPDPTSNSHLPAPDSHLPAPNSHLPAPNSHLPAPNSHLPVPDSHLPVPDSPILVASSLTGSTPATEASLNETAPSTPGPSMQSHLVAPGSHLPTPDSPFLTAASSLPTSPVDDLARIENTNSTLSPQLKCKATSGNLALAPLEGSGPSLDVTSLDVESTQCLQKLKPPTKAELRARAGSLQLKRIVQLLTPPTKRISYQPTSKSARRQHKMKLLSVDKPFNAVRARTTLFLLF